MKICTTLLFILLSFSILAQTGDKMGVVSLKRGKRLALVIGNGTYSDIRPLNNTDRDADSVSRVLKLAGFDVIPYKNLTLKGMQEAMNHFLAQLDKTRVEAVVVYFSGHGIGIDQTNYLLPIDTRFECTEQLKAYDSISLNTFVERVLAKEVPTNLFFVDACRSVGDLPPCFGVPTQGLTKPPEKYRGSLIAFATTAANTADDDTYDKVNSLFTAELIKFILLPNVGIRQTLDLTKQRVWIRSRGSQDPFRWDNLLQDFVFVQTNLPTKPPVFAQRIDVIAYKPNSNVLDMGLAKLTAKQLRQKYPTYEVRLKTDSEVLPTTGIVCTVRRSTETSPNAVAGYNLIKADTQLTLTFKKGKTLLDEIELNEGGTDHQKNNAIQNSIERAVGQMKDQTINLD